MSFVRLADNPAMLHQTRIAAASADALIGCDAVVSASPAAMKTYRKGTAAILNLAEMTTGEIIRNRDLDLQMDDRLATIAGACGSDAVEGFNANAIAETLLGDTVYANMMMLGAAWQAGHIPVSAQAIGQALALNRVKVGENRLAFNLGRLMQGNPAIVRAGTTPPAACRPAETFTDILSDRCVRLTDYQDAAYADRYRADIEAFAARCTDKVLRCTVARQLYRMMAYKDEYEVARLYCSARFREKLESGFVPGFRTANHLVFPFITRARDGRGRPKKTETRMMRHLFPLLARLKRLRGTVFDPFARQHERRVERGLIGWYLGLMAQYDPAGDPDEWCGILGAASEIRGFGPVKMTAIQTVKASVKARLLDSQAG